MVAHFSVTLIFKILRWNSKTFDESKAVLKIVDMVSPVSSISDTVYVKCHYFKHRCCLYLQQNTIFQWHEVILIDWFQLPFTCDLLTTCPGYKYLKRGNMVFVERNRLRWRHNDHAGVSNHQPHGCLLNRLFRRKSKKTSKLRVTGLCAGNSPGTGEFPAQMASYAENVSICWRHHAISYQLQERAGRGIDVTAWDNSQRHTPQTWSNIQRITWLNYTKWPTDHIFIWSWQ